MAKWVLQLIYVVAVIAMSLGFAALMADVVPLAYQRAVAIGVFLMFCLSYVKWLWKYDRPRDEWDSLK